MTSSKVISDVAEARPPLWRRAVALAFVIAAGAITLHVINIFLVMSQQRWIDATREEISRERIAVNVDRGRVEAQLAQYDQLRSRILEQSGQANALALRIESLRTQLGDLDQIKQQRDQAVADRQEALEAQRRAELARDEAEGARRTARTDVESLGARIQAARGQLDGVNRQVSETQDGLLRLQDDLRRQQAERTSSETATRTAVTARQTADSQAETARLALTKANQDTAAGQRDLEALRTALGAQRAEVTATEARRAEADRAVQTIQDRIRQAQAVIEELTTQRRQLLEEAKRLRDDQTAILASGDANQNNSGCADRGSEAGARKASGPFG